MKQLLQRRFLWLLCISGYALEVVGQGGSQADTSSLSEVRRILFLGDSITYSGQYVEYCETFLASRFPNRPIEILNLGLPSETVSGLSEEGHAGGRFPRPDLHERLDRVLAATKPDLVIACYGMNDGIYLPFRNERFQAFQNGIARLRAKVMAAGARVIHLTPPVFDPRPNRDGALPLDNYNDVLDRYSEWLLGQRADGWSVLDIHGPMARFLSTHRQQDPAYRLAGDGVHPNDVGHWVMARPLLLHFGAPATVASMEKVEEWLGIVPNGAELLGLVQQRQRMLKDAWLTHVGHQRPGMKTGLPLAEAQKKAAELEKHIRLTATLPSPQTRRDAKGVVTIACDPANLVIRYTLDGSVPERAAGAYLAPIALPQGGTVRARAFAEGDQVRGSVVSATFEPVAGATGTPPHSALLPVTQNRDWRIYDWAARHAAVCTLVRERKPDLVFIGDSITHFWGGEPAAQRRTASDVWQKFYGSRNAVNLGFGWDRTENVLWRLQHGELDGVSPKVAVVLIGTNNLDVNTPDEIADGIRAVWRELRARLPQTRILLLAILPRSARPDDRRARLAEVNRSIAALDGQEGVTYLDVGSEFLGADGSISRELMGDHLHPTAKGYEILAQAIEPTLVRLLRGE